MKLSFEALEALDAIDRTGTFAEAAELLHRVPSALTYQVQKLESDLGIALFDRSGRRAKLTHAGRVVVEEGRRLLRAAEQLELKALRVQQGWETEVRVCIDEILPFDSLWPYVHRFYALGMDTRLRLSTEVLGGAWDALISRRADLVVGAAGEPPELPDIIARPIGSLKHVFAVAPSHPLAALPEPLSMASVVQYRGAVISDTSRELQPQSIGIDPGQPYLAVPTLTAKLEAQCAGLAVGTLPECIAAPAIASGKLVAREVTGMRDTTHCYLAWRGDEAGRALHWWVEQLDKPHLVDCFTAPH
ncbi:LysR family transcriptional regulator [Burkholderia vietnamiensis]|uniref:Transcriptional regulator, LysR family n=2 Tax=Burkholderia vietnamiensis TaxID=60552 RepID=A4JSL4_BURVG|nr:MULTISPECIES: LysR family transcriptional regulator [Burkholderia]ABO59267.1 transcriptional regulator, LysR family [Burkholderia vietnamiensis G4]TPQ48548.1 LysR family transcriptional regulator [Burkholderia ubonensis]AJY08564.1 bacterial regulatory helix-turn-helix, lysR family protein [Burkholderia vietnamiensis LMG 10929]AOJ16916.1 LysR family transcriptional regulator [Burkholderia vietnamiensis]AOK01985.1 LysR family transcriptional regulator [Burkholderia vietnamiensis]